MAPSSREKNRATQSCLYLLEWIWNRFWTSRLFTKFKLVASAIAAITAIVLAIHYYHHSHFTPEPWRHYCLLRPPFPPKSTPIAYSLLASAQARAYQPYNFGQTAAVGVFIGVMTSDVGFHRRQQIRNGWASHWFSRGKWEKAGFVYNPDQAGWWNGTDRVVVRFVMGQPSDEWKVKIQAEVDMYHDIIILPITENMNNGKTFAFFDWAYQHAWVPPPRDNVSHPLLNRATIKLAPHDPVASGEGWARPDYVLKADDDSLIMLAELEARMRVMPRKLVYWGYLVRDKYKVFHAGEAYGLSWDLVTYIATDPVPRTLTVGREDQVTSWWLLRHPQALEIVWWHENCWVYDGPKAGTVHAKGVLFPYSLHHLRKSLPPVPPPVTTGGKRKEWAWDRRRWGEPGLSTVARYYWRNSYDFANKWKTPYLAPNPRLESGEHELMRLEALIEGSEMSMLDVDADKEGITQAWQNRKSMAQKYLVDGKQVPVPMGGTIVVHYLKRDEDWYDAENILLHSWDRELISRS